MKLDTWRKLLMIRNAMLPPPPPRNAKTTRILIKPKWNTSVHYRAGRKNYRHSSVISFALFPFHSRQRSIKWNDNATRGKDGGEAISLVHFPGTNIGWKLKYLLANNRPTRIEIDITILVHFYRLKKYVLISKELLIERYIKRMAVSTRSRARFADSKGDIGGTRGSIDACYAELRGVCFNSGWNSIRNSGNWRPDGQSARIWSRVEVR